MTHQSKTPLPIMDHRDEDVERGHMWSTGNSNLNIPWQRPYATGTPLPGSPVRHRSLDETADDESSNHLLLTFKERVRHFVWTWFTMTMATGQLANVILTGMCVHNSSGSQEIDFQS